MKCFFPRRILHISTISSVVGVALTSSLALAGSVDRVWGTVEVDSNNSVIQVQASSGPNGENAQGSFSHKEGSIQHSGDVTCLSVIGKWAVVGGVITESNLPNAQGTTYLLFINENSKDEGTRVATLSGYTPVPGPTCPSPVQLEGLIANKGKIVVQDKN